MKYQEADSAFLKRSDLTSLAIVLLHLTLVLTPVYLATLVGVRIHLVFNWIVLGLAMNALLNLMHECSHYHVFKKKWGCIFLGRWILGPLALADFDGYQKRHWDHHRKLGETDDPKYIYRVDIRGWRFIALFLRCLFLIEAFKRFTVQADPRKNAELTRISSWFWLIRTLCVQVLFASSILLSALAATPDEPSHALRVATLSYLVVYLHAIGSVTTFVSSLRAIAEHHIGADDAATVNGAALRNFASGRSLNLILGIYGFSDHATHHKEPGIPYYRLKIMTRELARSEPAFEPIHTYHSTLFSLISS